MNARSLALAGLLAAVSSTPVAAHCQVPCGIYDDHARIHAMQEDATTIEKAMKQIESLSGSIKIANVNQAVRWVHTKEEHAQRIQDVAAQYFLAQRVKFPGNSTAAKHAYGDQLEAIHQVTVYAMKCKQTTDTANVMKLRAAIARLEEVLVR